MGTTRLTMRRVVRRLTHLTDRAAAYRATPHTPSRVRLDTDRIDRADAQQHPRLRRISTWPGDHHARHARHEGARSALAALSAHGTPSLRFSNADGTVVVAPARPTRARRTDTNSPATARVVGTTANTIPHIHATHAAPREVVDRSLRGSMPRIRIASVATALTLSVQCEHLYECINCNSAHIGIIISKHCQDRICVLFEHIRHDIEQTLQCKYAHFSNRV